MLLDLELIRKELLCLEVGLGNNLHSNPWTPEEDDQLIKDFDTGVTLRELLLKLGRNMGAIQTRLLSLGRKIL